MKTFTYSMHYIIYIIFSPSSHCYHRRQCPAIHRCRYLHRKVKVRNHGCLFHRKKNITSHMLNFKFSLNLFEFILNFFLKITLPSNYFNKLFFLYFFFRSSKNDSENLKILSVRRTRQSCAVLNPSYESNEELNRGELK